MSSAVFYTIGYQGRTIEEFIAELKAAGVKTLVDIRYNPVSRFKPGFSKRNLQNALQCEGIGYIHRRDLGIPSAVRNQPIPSGSLSGARGWYAENVLAHLAPKELRAIVASYSQPVALMCMEANAADCHRRILSRALEEVGLTCKEI
jgi:uncharacterized protein (DUF488 family)